MDIELSNQAFYEAWQHFKLGTPPITLNVLPEGVLEDERRAAQRRAHEELRRHGLGDFDKEDILHGVFLPLHRYERCFDISYRHKFSGQEQKLAGMVASAGNAATLAVRSHTSIRLVRLRAESMVRALLSVLPELQAGSGKAVSLRSAQLDAAAAKAGESDRAMADGLSRNGVKREDARLLVDMAGGDRLGFAQVGASIMDGQGKRARAPMVTNCFATAKGWYLIEETRRSGEPWTTIAPIDKQRLAPRIEQLMKTFAPAY